MVAIDQKRLSIINENFKNKRILIIGDLMLDEYLIGNVIRISPEAPVPVVEVAEQQVRFGGAANVALNVTAMGCIPVLVGVLGNDREADIFSNLMIEHNMDDSGLLRLDRRHTTVKTRVIGHSQHITRVDRETKEYLSEQEERTLINLIIDQIDGVDGIILQDYNKGVLTEKVIFETIAVARAKDKLITVDPKFINFHKFSNVSLFKPNIKETEEALAIKISSEQDLLDAGQRLLKILNPESVLITRGPAGMSLFEASGAITHIPTQARKIADVSGAGDTVISTLTAALIGDASYQEAAIIANFAAGIVCEEVGIVPIDKEKLMKVCCG